MKQKIIIIGDTTDANWVAAKQMLEERWQVTTVPIRDDEHSPGRKAAEPEAIRHQPIEKERKEKRRTRHVIPGTNTVEILCKFLAGRIDREATFTDLEKEFERLGFAPNSVRGAVGIARANGWVKTTRDAVSSRGLELPSITAIKHAMARSKKNSAEETTH